MTGSLLPLPVKTSLMTQEPDTGVNWERRQGSGLLGSLHNNLLIPSRFNSLNDFQYADPIPSRISK